VGDLLLQLIAQRLSDTMAASVVARQGGGVTIARLGGDEFILLLEGLTDFAVATQAATQLLDVLATPYLIKGHEIRSTASIGITTSANAYDNCGAMVRDADTALYRAKATGKAKYVLFDQQMHVEVIERLKLESQMTKALEDGEFRLVYQPIISLESNLLQGFEALLRWNNPQLGAVSPGRFVPVAEENGLIVPIGAWVLESACQQLADWHRRFPQRADLTVSVNLSRRQLISPELLPLVRRMIASTRINPRRLKLEITENTIMSDGALTTRIIKELRALEVAVQMDDFGTGHSSLGSLNDLPLDAIKIDPAFIRTVTEHRKYAAVVQAIGALARTLNVELIAEGVETADQVSMLQAMDVPLGQGYVFAQPLEANEATEFIRASVLRQHAA
jgi:diguanylate cyclase (GGDEF)-like protein